MSSPTNIAIVAVADTLLVAGVVFHFVSAGGDAALKVASVAGGAAFEGGEDDVDSSVMLNKKNKKKKFDPDQDELRKDERWKASPIRKKNRVGRSFCSNYWVCFFRKHLLTSALFAYHPHISRAERALMGVMTCLGMWLFASIVQDFGWLRFTNNIGGVLQVETSFFTVSVAFVATRACLTFAECLCRSKILKIIMMIGLSLSVVLAHFGSFFLMAHLKPSELDTLWITAILMFSLELIVWPLASTLLQVQLCRALLLKVISPKFQLVANPVVYNYLNGEGLRQPEIEVII